MIRRQYLVAFSYSEPHSVTNSEKASLKGSFEKTIFSKGVIIKEFSLLDEGVLLSVELESSAVLSKVVNSLKTLSSRKTNGEQRLRKGGLWKRGYSVSTLGLPLTFEELTK